MLPNHAGDRSFDSCQTPARIRRMMRIASRPRRLRAIIDEIARAAQLMPLFYRICEEPRIAGSIRKFATRICEFNGERPQREASHEQFRAF